MPFDVFISYSTKDKKVADQVCQALESAGIRCWIAPRDIPKGAIFAEEIANAIEQCRFFVLVFTSEANASKYVYNELEYAYNNDKVIIAFRVEVFEPAKRFKFYLNTVQWLNAIIPPVETYLPELIQEVRSRLPEPPAPASPPAPRVEPVFPPEPPASAIDQLPEWLKEKEGSANAPSGAIDQVPDWLKEVERGSESSTGAIDQVPDWLKEGEREPEPSAGDNRVREVDGMVEVYVPAGEFLMGSNDSADNEKPLHKITLDGYWIDQVPVSNAMFARFLGERGNQDEENTGWYYPVFGRIKQEGKVFRVDGGFEQHPVVGVTWYGARAYALWVGARLPTEAQWEKAARGTDGRKYPWGDTEPDSTLANYNQNVGTTTPVGSYPAGASPYGVLDMAGNVWEWCADWHNKAYYAKSPPKNPTGPASGVMHVLRGGSWINEVRCLRAAFRNWDNPNLRSGSQGFRCCRREALPKGADFLNAAVQTPS